MSRRRPRSWRRISLVTRMIAIVAVLVLVATAAGGVSAYLVARATIEGEIQFAGQSLAHSLSGSIVTLINKPGAEGELQMALNQLLEVDDEGRISDAYIVSKDMHIMAARDPQRVGKRFTELDGLAKVDHMYVVRRPGFGTSIAAPVQWGKTSKRTLGYVVLFSSEKAFTAARDRVLIWFTGIFLAAVLAAILFTRLVMRRLLQPVVDLGEAARALADGNSDYPLDPPQSQDEIGVATRSFLAMRDAQKIFVRFSNPALVRRIRDGLVPERPEEVKLAIGFGDGVRFTDWSSANTAAEISTMLTDYFTLFGLLVEEFDGIVEKFIGDAVMSYYGLHSEAGTESVARDAIRTHLCGQIVFGLANRVFRDYQRRLPLRFRFGIATGKCVVGPMGARGVKQDYTIIGTTVNLASRLEGLAQPGGLTIDNFTYQNAGGADFLVAEEPREERIKGFTDPVKVYVVTGLREPAENQRLSELLVQYFERDAVRDVLRLDDEQHATFREEVERVLTASTLALPVETPAA